MATYIKRRSSSRPRFPSCSAIWLGKSSSSNPTTNTTRNSRPLALCTDMSVIFSSTQFPPSVWGKTLKRVSSLPRTQATSSSSGGVSPSAITPRVHVSPSANPSLASAPKSESKSLRVGCSVQHSRFGRGTVLAVEGSGLDAKATVKFDNVGTKQLLLRFAKIEVL